MGFDSKCDFAPPTVLLASPCLWTWGSSSKSLQCQVATAPVPTVLLGLLYPWMWGIFSQLLQHHVAPAILKLAYGTLALEEGSGTPLQYSCLENPMDGGAW